MQEATKVYRRAQGTIVNILMENNFKNNICVFVQLNHLALYPKHCKSTILQ